jgi:hypothetical protein
MGIGLGMGMVTGSIIGVDFGLRFYFSLNVEQRISTEELG